MLAELIAAIFNLIKKGKFEQASQAIENVYHDLLKEDSCYFKNIPKERLTTALIQDHNYTNGHLQIVAELFFAEAELEYAKGLHTESKEFYEKSLFLFEFIEHESKTLSIERHNKMDLIRNRISEHNKVQ